MRARELSFLERRRLSKDRALVNDLLGPGERLEGNARDLQKLQIILSANVSQDALVGLGTAFGDVLASELGLSWVVVTDSFGTDKALQAKPYQVFVHPRGMFTKRISRGEKPNEIDLGFMLEELRKTVNEKKPGAATSEP